MPREARTGIIHENVVLGAIGICCLAIVWQYIVIGIALGVAIVVLLIFLNHFAS